MSDDDLIRRGDVLRILIGAADIQRGPSTDKQRMIRAIPARGVGVRLHDLPDGVLMAAMMAVEEMDHQLNWFQHWGGDVSGWKDDAKPEIRGRYADALQRVSQFRAILAALAPTPAAQAREAVLLQRAAQLAYEVWDDPAALAKSILALGDPRK